MQLNPNLSGPEIITTAPLLLVYIEKTGPFMRSAPQAWKDFRALSKNKLDESLVTGKMSLSRIDPQVKGDAAYTYQAAMVVSSEPARVPVGLDVRELGSAVYAKYTLVGSYGQLPAAYPLIFANLEDSGIERANDFCIEHYIGTSEGTPIEELVTEILIPVI
jgi:DNA gyrase inhibitor GyrI